MLVPRTAHVPFLDPRRAVADGGGGDGRNEWRGEKALAGRIGRPVEWRDNTSHHHSGKGQIVRCALQLTELAFVLCLSALLGFAPPRSFAIEPTDYERELLAERRSIVQLHVEVDTDHFSGNGVQLTRSKRTIWQDGPKRRWDETREYLDGKGVTEVPPYRLVGITTPEYFFCWDGRPQPPPSKLVAHFELPSDARKLKFFRPMLPYDFRPIGVVFAFQLDHEEFLWDDVVGTPDRVAPATVVKNGEQVTLSFVKQKTKTNALIDDLIVEQTYERRGDKYLLLSLETSDESKRYRGSMRCIYPNMLVGGFSFPETIESYNQYDKNILRETSKLRIKSVNEPIPRSRFSIVTTEIPEGTMVVGTAIPPELNKPFHHIQWNGEALVPVSNSEITLRNANDNQGPM